MKLTLEMLAGRDFDKTGANENMIKEAIQKRVRLLLNLRREDSVYVKINKKAKAGSLKK